MTASRVFLAGRLPRDAGCLQHTANGTPMIAFSVALRGPKERRSGLPDFVRVLGFGPLAEQLANRGLNAGDRIYVVGRAEDYVWLSPDGDTRPSVKVIAWAIKVRPPRRERRTGRRPLESGQLVDQPVPDQAG